MIRKVLGPEVVEVGSTWRDSHCRRPKPEAEVGKGREGLLQVLFFCCPTTYQYLSMAQSVKNQPAMQETQETQVQSLGQEDPLEQENGNPL